jgi:signal transduction histidine kinase
VVELVLPLLISGLLVGCFVLSAVFLGYCLRNRDKPAAELLAILFAGILLWVLAEFLPVVIPPSLFPAVVHLRLLAPDIVSTGAVLFVFAYTGREWILSRTVIGVLAIKPIAMQLVLLSPYREQLAQLPRHSDPFGYGFELTPLFTVHAVYDWLLPITAFVLLFQTLTQANKGYQRDIVLLVIAFFAPTISSMLYHLGPLSIDLSAVSFLVTTSIAMYVVFKLRFIDAVPIAHDIVFDEMDELVFITDENARIRTINSSAEALFGDEDTLLGTSITDVLGSDVLSTDTDSDSPLDITVALADRQRSLTVDRSVLTDYRGDPLGQLFVCRDITERKRRERELRRQNERLDKFASVVSHDLRNPLSVASGYAELAEETGDPSAFEKVHDAHERMGTMIEELLTLARSETAIETTDSVSLAKQAQTAWGTAETGNATFELTVPDDVTLNAEPKLLRHILENLYRNATDHNDPPLTITVGMLDVGPTGFHVEDDGTGIPEEDRETIFDHGYTTADDGTGLGLSIVAEFVEAHGWEITATESESGGARFEIRTE